MNAINRFPLPGMILDHTRGKAKVHKNAEGKWYVVWEKDGLGVKPERSGLEDNFIHECWEIYKYPEELFTKELTTEQAKQLPEGTPLKVVHTNSAIWTGTVGGLYNNHGHYKSSIGLILDIKSTEGHGYKEDGFSADNGWKFFALSEETTTLDFATGELSTGKTVDCGDDAYCCCTYPQIEKRTTSIFGVGAAQWYYYCLKCKKEVRSYSPPLPEDNNIPF